MLNLTKIIFLTRPQPKYNNRTNKCVSRCKFLSLIQRDIEKTVIAAQRVEGNEDSLDVPPFLRRNVGGFSVDRSVSQNGHSS